MSWDLLIGGTLTLSINKRMGIDPTVMPGYVAKRGICTFKVRAVHCLYFISLVSFVREHFGVNGIKSRHWAASRGFSALT